MDQVLPRSNYFFSPLETPELLLDDDMETEEDTGVNASLVVFDENSENFVETNDLTTTAPILKMDDYENSKKSKRKSVRFLNATPDGDNHKISDIEEDEEDQGLLCNFTKFLFLQKILLQSCAISRNFCFNNRPCHTITNFAKYLIDQNIPIPY